MGERGNLVTDYVIGDEETRGDILNFEVGESVESDHHPLIVTIREARRGKKEEEGGE